MFIKQITIDGVEGDVEVLHIDGGALVTTGNGVICELRREDSPEARYAKAREVAKVVCGVTKRTRFGPAGEPNATNSMIHDVLRAIEEVAGC